LNLKHFNDIAKNDFLLILFTQDSALISQDLSLIRVSKSYDMVTLRIRIRRTRDCVR